MLERYEKQLSVFILYNGKELPEFNELFEKMELVINRLKKYITEGSVEKNQWNIKRAIYTADKNISVDHLPVAGTQVQVYTYLFAICIDRF